MPDCDYCDAGFDDEEEYLQHLADEHEGELGRIDRRRVEDMQGDGTGLSATTLAGAGVAVAIVAVVAAVFLLDSGGGARASGQPYDVGSVHGHGNINVTIDGRTLDFTQDRYQLQDRAFHFEGGTDVWHVHAKGVTLEYAMSTLGIEIDGRCVTFEGTTYCDSDPGTTVEITVDGQSVNASNYVLEGIGDVEAVRAGEGPMVRVIVRTDGSAAVDGAAVARTDR